MRPALLALVALLAGCDMPPTAPVVPPCTLETALAVDTLTVYIPGIQPGVYNITRCP